MNSVFKSFRSLNTIKSLKSNNSIKSLNPNNFRKNSVLMNITIFIYSSLTVGYIINKHYRALLFMYLLSLIIFIVNKNLLYSLGISILLTNLLLSMKLFKNTEGLKNKKEQEKEEQEKQQEEEEDEILDLNNKMKEIKDSITIGNI